MVRSRNFLGYRKTLHTLETQECVSKNVQYYLLGLTRLHTCPSFGNDCDQCGYVVRWFITRAKKFMRNNTLKRLANVTIDNIGYVRCSQMPEIYLTRIFGANPLRYSEVDITQAISPLTRLKSGAILNVHMDEVLYAKYSKYLDDSHHYYRNAIDKNIIVCRSCYRTYFIRFKNSKKREKHIYIHNCSICDRYIDTSMDFYIDTSMRLLCDYVRKTHNDIPRFK